MRYRWLKLSAHRIGPVLIRARKMTCRRIHRSISIPSSNVAIDLSWRIIIVAWMLVPKTHAHRVTSKRCQRHVFTLQPFQKWWLSDVIDKEWDNFGGGAWQCFSAGWIMSLLFGRKRSRCESYIFVLVWCDVRALLVYWIHFETVDFPMKHCLFASI